MKMMHMTSTNNSEIASGSQYEKQGNTEQLLRSVFALSKQLDNCKRPAKTVTHLLTEIEDLESRRLKLVEASEVLLFLDDGTTGRKSRKMMWHKGYYEFVAAAKCLAINKGDEPENKLAREKLRALLLEGISRCKRIVVRFDKEYDLDLRYIIDFSIIDANNGLTNGHSFIEAPEIDQIDYAVEMVHSFLVSLGDLHRYFVDFGFTTPALTKQDASQFYFNAFKLNSTVGMPLNQLGTLFSGVNYNLDSVYFYLYSLMSPKPFELSESNVSKIFTANADYIEQMEVNEELGPSLHDFIARFLLVVDILFYEKNVPNFIELCQCMLIDFKKLLVSQRAPLTSDIIFKLVGTLFLCMLKLQVSHSPTISQLNALLVAICAELVDRCIFNLDTFMTDHTADQDMFREKYLLAFTSVDCLEAKEEKCKSLLKQKCESIHQNGDKSLPTTSNSSGEVAPKITKELEFQKTGESGRTDGSDPDKLKKKQPKDRRRRRCANFSDDDSSGSDELSSNFDSDNESEYSEISSNLSYSSDSEEEEGVNALKNGKKFDPNASDSDVVIEEEEIIYMNGDSDKKSTPSPQCVERIMNNLISHDIGNLNFHSDTDDIVVEEEQLIYLNNGSSSVESLEKSQITLPIRRAKNTKSYDKPDPNLVIKFGSIEPSMATLKVMFDWLRLNVEILTGCYKTNPEFITKIMNLLNQLHIDIFTRQVFFPREFITTQGLRDDIRTLFDERHRTPLPEDVSLKQHPVLCSSHAILDWEKPIRCKITETEEHFLRLAKCVDFGFFLCKTKQFHYDYCQKSRTFTVGRVEKRQRAKRRNGAGRGIANGGCGSNGNGTSSVKKRGGRRSKKNRDTLRRQIYEQERRFEKTKLTYPSEDAVDDEASNAMPKKSYFKNRNNHLIAKEVGKEDGGPPTEVQKKKNKAEIMGELWLANEVKTLESKVRKPNNVHLTPYLVVDASSLIDFNSIVKNLLKSKKFVILVPKAVLSELDDLKKQSESARNVIRWLEQEFKKGNRFLRSQRSNETLQLPLLKIKKLERDASIFMQIVQFCNYMVHNDREEGQIQHDVLTLLTGESLISKKCTQFSYCGLLSSIPVKTEQISRFYASYKNK